MQKCINPVKIGLEINGTSGISEIMTRNKRSSYLNKFWLSKCKPVRNKTLYLHWALISFSGFNTNTLFFQEYPDKAVETISHKLELLAERVVRLRKLVE